MAVWTQISIGFRPFLEGCLAQCRLVAGHLERARGCPTPDGLESGSEKPKIGRFAGPSRGISQFWMVLSPSQPLHSPTAFGIRLRLPAAPSAAGNASYGCGCSSVVEHDLAKVGVEGSSPFARSSFFLDLQGRFRGRPSRSGLAVVRPHHGFLLQNEVSARRLRSPRCG